MSVLSVWLKKRNWKTTAAGVGAILAAVGGWMSGGLEASEAIPAIVAGMGLAMAKDGAVVKAE